MRFLLDHDVPHEIFRVLTQDGHEVTLVKDALRPTASDPEVFEHSIHSRSVLISCNRDDFLSLASERQHVGLIVLIRRRTRIAECAALIRLVRSAGQVGLAGSVNFA